MKQCSSPEVLIVEDSHAIGFTTQNWLAQENVETTLVETGAEALAHLRQHKTALVLLDLQLPDMSGLDILRTIKNENIHTKVIVITSVGSIKMAIDVMRAHAHDYIVKPAARDRLTTAVHDVLSQPLVQSLPEQTQTAAEKPLNPSLNPPLNSCAHLNPCGQADFIGSSLVMQNIYQKIQAVSRSTASVFITGESGTGKDVCAQAIHNASPRHTEPFIALNCAAIPKDLLESEIFGHLKGAFSGATANRDGAALTANGGTLFLDEICELDLSLQSKLLRFLQTGTVQKVGSDKSERVDIRIICASNKDPHTEVYEGRFREDLFYRLHVVPLHLPPLREREDDILEISNHLLKKIAKEEGKHFDCFTIDAQHALLSHSWPGNIRELQNVIRHAIVLHDEGDIKAHMLPITSSLRTQARTMQHALQKNKSEHMPFTVSLGQSYETIEREIVEATIRLCEGSIPKAAQLLNLSPSTIYRKREAWS